ncbi:MAG TPA: prephenate dehydrogenase/arogenate dehydrogenase family protein [Tepidisphaeraceae bacterium]
MRNFTIIGVGLLGGSLGLALKGRFAGCRVVGCAHRDASLIEAERLGVVDTWTLDPAAAVRDADCVVVCVPVRQVGPWLAKIGPHLKAGAIVTDVGSTKAAIVKAGETHVTAPAFFVGSHPMAGGSQSGVAAARADLFDGATCVLTPTPATNAEALAAVDDLWKTLGMRVVRHAPAEHDRLVARVSHLPHAVAAALVAVQSDASIDLRGKGFTDTTRIAAGEAGLWRDIFLDNRENVVGAIDALMNELQGVREILAATDEARLIDWLGQQQRRRAKIDSDVGDGFGAA